MKKIFLAAAASFAFLGTASAQEVSVSIESWMLETEEGRQHVYGVLERRAQRACSQRGSLRLDRGRSECIADLLDQLIEGVGSEQMTRLHLGGDELRLAEAQ